MKLGFSTTRLLIAMAVTTISGPVAAQSPVAVDDFYNAGSGFLLQVEAPGVLENDHDGGGEPPPPPTAIAQLVSDVSFGVLVLNGDGSFDYTSNPGFIGEDSFTYFFVDGAATSNTATVTITVDGCEPGVAPTQWVCWIEQAYLAKAAELGLSAVVESFEDDSAWAATRSPSTAPTAVSQDITWASNFAFNNVTTGGGPARSGSWGFYSLPHGDQSGAPGDRIYDGFTGSAASPDSLLGVGGWLVASQVGARVDLIVTHDGGATTTAGFPDHGLTVSHRFFGLIDTAGFTSFEVVETDGTVNQPFFVFGDDFSFLTSGGDIIPPIVTEIGSWEETADGVITEGEIVDVAITELMVRFSEPVQDPPGDADPDDVTNPANYLLFDDGGDGFDTSSCAGGVALGDNPIAIEVWSYVSGNPSETVLGVNGGVALPAGSYRLLVCGTTSIIDWAGNTLDGDGNGTGGDDFVRNFSVTGTVNQPPSANPQTVSTPEDTGLAITLTASDPDGDPLTYAIATGPTHGVLSGSPPAVTYTPAADYFGPDSFTFTASDGSLTSLPAMVTIDVLPVNDPPTADDQSVTTAEDTAVAITLTGGDVDGDPLTFVIGTVPVHGGLTGTPPNVTYTPDADYHGPDGFSFTTTDGSLTSATATVSITVDPINDTPLAVDDGATTDEDVAVTIDVLINDQLGDPPTSITSITQGANGAVAIDPGATTVTYTPNPDFNGPDSFTYTITDVDLETSTATVTVTVNPAPDPVLTMGDASLSEPDAGTATLTATISVSDPGPTDITVGVATEDGTATAGDDYVASSGTVVIPAHATSHDVTLEVIGDLIDEPDETFSVRLGNPVGATIGVPSDGTITILDNDPMSELATADVTVGEAAGSAEISLTLDRPSGFTITVDYATADGTAVSPADYAAVGDIATIPPGSMSASITVPIVDDTEIEIDEFFSVELSLPTNAVLMTSTSVVTIIDDDDCNIAGDADGSCVLDAADMSLIIALIDDPTIPAAGDPDCTGDSVVDGRDLACVAQAVVAQ
jgi:hypothetical protein